VEWSKDDIIAIINVEITKRFQNIGIWETDMNEIEITRANNKYLNELRKTKEKRTEYTGKSARDIVTTIGAQAIWLALTCAGTWLWLEVIKK
jgi:hypothetical protein